MYWNWKQNFARPGVYPGSFLVFWKMNRRHRPLQEFAMRFFELPEKGRVLDVGCGGGSFIAMMLKRAPETQFHGVDYSPVSVKKSLSFNRGAVRDGQVKIVQGSVSALPFEPDFFDLVTASETIYFWPDPANDVREVARVLKPGGVFAVCCDAADKEAAKRVDYSPVSVKKSLSFNRGAVRDGQVKIVQGSVSALPFEPDFFDLVTASETIYFWPDPANDVREVARVLKPGGVFAVCCDAADKEAAKRYTDRIRGMTVYTPEELSGFLAGAGLTGIECHSDPATGMVCVTGRKPAGSGSES